MQCKDPRERVLVDLDVSSTGIWVKGGNASYDYFDLPPWLIARFEFWTWWYNRWEPWTDKDGGKDRKPDDELFQAYGLSLAVDLQRVLGPDVEVFYIGRKKEISIPYPRDIKEVEDHLPPNSQPSCNEWVKFFPIHKMSGKKRKR